MNDVELRWVTRKEYTYVVLGELMHTKTQVLQYRKMEGHETVGGKPIFVWSEWIDVPTVEG